MTQNLSSREAQKTLTNLMTKFISLVAIRLPDDVLSALTRGSKIEDSPHVKLVYEAIFRNLDIAASRRIPLCQDTGVLQFFVYLGENFPYKRELLEALREATIRATSEGFLRPNVVDPITNTNTGNNTGARIPWIEIELLPNTDHAEIQLYMAGGGSSRPGYARVLDPAVGLSGAIEFVLNVIAEYGPPACPPLVVGVGIGPTVEIAALLSKKALLRTPLGSRNPNPRVAALEEKLEEAINELGIGPQGLGGKVSVLATHIEYAGRHPSTIAVGVSTACWALRKGWLRISKDLGYEVLSHRGVTLE